MKYEGHMVNIELKRSSKIPLKATSDDDAVKEFKMLRLAHECPGGSGKLPSLTLKLMKIGDEGKETEIVVE